MNFPIDHYRATVLTVHDGDTAHLRIDRGFGLYWEVRCRLAGINAPELSTGAPGAKSRDWLIARITGKTLFVVAGVFDNYGRPLVTLYEPEPATVDAHLSINQQMIDLGLAVIDGHMKVQVP